MANKEQIIRVDEFDPSIIDDMPVQPKGNKKRGGSRLYLADPITFDIECSSLTESELSFMYIWQMQITDDLTVIGRTWDEFRDMYDIINEHVGNGHMIVCYVHNLSYEWQYLKDVIPIDDVFALDDRKVLKFMSGRIEFRCSYLHSNMSLSKFLKSMNVPDQKTELDYSVIRYPWTILTDEEIRYCVNDVKGLREALIIEMQRDGDDLYTIPLTSTGYVRRDAKDALKGYQRYIKKMLPDREIFDMLRAAFRGGNTHANRYNADRVIRATDEYPINSYDISSSYPSVLMSEKYPTIFVPGDIDYLYLYIQHGKACLMTIRLFDVRLKDESFPVPYIPEAKCNYVIDPILDNGRIIRASALEMTITEVDLSIIEEEYIFEYEIVKLFVAPKRPLPERFKDLLMNIYRQKTALKGAGDEYAYQKIKNKFNSFYGMCVQNPCKQTMIFRNGVLIPDESKTEDDMIADYKNKGWLPYQWGVWCTAYARRKLEDGIMAVDNDGFLYCDTDSVKMVGDYEFEFDLLNTMYQYDKWSAVDKNNRIHYLGIFEKDNDKPIRAFCTLGAKKYVYEDDDGLHITISGVDKRIGAEELGSIENFRDGFIFTKAGGVEAIYNDYRNERKYITVEGRRIRITSNVYLKPSTYTLSLDFEYKRLINYLMNVDIKRFVYYDYD